MAAATVAGGLLTGALLAIGMPKNLTLDTTALLDLVKISLAVVGGIGGAVALVIAYRRQRLTEEDNHRARQAAHREDTKLYIERFDKATDKLGSDAPAVRLAGVHALAALADDWRGGRQMCIDVLCAYLRMPPEPSPAQDAAKYATWRAMREVRATIARLIAVHLRAGSASWCGSDLDFTGVVFDDEADFSNVIISGGSVSFRGAVFSGSEVSFTGAMFSNGTTLFDNAVFSGSEVSFVFAKFAGGEVSFDAAEFSGGEVDFIAAEFTGGRMSFNGAKFSGGEVSFDGAYFMDGRTLFDEAVFASGKVSFGGGKFSGRGVWFSKAVFSGGEMSFRGAEFVGGEAATGGDVAFDRVQFTGGEMVFDEAAFIGGEMVFDEAAFIGGEVRFNAVADWSCPPTGLPAKAPGLHLPTSSAVAADDSQTVAGNPN
ncbi:hypothetical protein GCM10022419_045530 [Nonomuraea rosea]|uniref:Pentapeptide repeat-containing protein n=1 Tax=Nonomuraea rosea TaxID=638574 RepID=A0ABP6X6P2_9ACTN